MLSNWTKATTTTTGTGTLTLSAVSGRPLPSAAHPVGELVQYSIKTSDGKFESGIGTIATSNTFERTKIFSTYDGTTYNNTSATVLSLASGTHEVFITAISEVLPGALRFPLVGPTNAATYTTHVGSSAANETVAASAANRANAYPFNLEVSGVLTGLGIYCSIAGATSTTDLAVYEPDTNGRPGRRLAVLASTLDTTTTGYKSGSVASNIRLVPGWYWVGICITGTAPSFTSATTNGSAFSRASGTATQLTRLYENVSSSLADPFPQTSLIYTTENTGKVPLVGFILS